MSKKNLFGTEARAAVLRGVDCLANAVKVTLGPEGRTVIIGRRHMGLAPLVTKDGVTVANHCNPSVPEEQIGADLVREAAQRTVEQAGDGTTTATVLAQAIIRGGIEAIDTHSPVGIKRGIDLAVKAIVAELEAMAVAATGEMLRQVATISANGDESVGELVFEAIEKVGKDGVITCEESRTAKTDLTVVDGMQLYSGMLSPYFMTDPERLECVFEDALVFLYEGRLTSSRAVAAVAQKAIEAKSPLLVIAGDFEADALSSLVLNRTKNSLPLCAVRLDIYGTRGKEVLRDIAALTGGRAITEDMGVSLEHVTLDDLGRAKRIVVGQVTTIIAQGGGRQSDVAGRVKEIREKIEKGENEAVDTRLLQQRLAGLTGGVAVIRVGGATFTEMTERKDRVEDAMFAAKAAAESGVVVGGGMALLLAADRSRGVVADGAEEAGVLIVKRACEEPLRQIATNCGVQTDVVSIVKSSGLGFNAATGEYVDLLAVGIIDPLKVVRQALVNAASVAGNILISEAVIAETLQGRTEAAQ